MFFARPRTFLLLALAASAVLGFFQNQIDPYYVDVLTRIGINIVLAVSLNLINGHTGQFSLGHAGFMAVGAYTAAAVTMFAGPHVLPVNAPTIIIMLWFLVALLAGGAMAAAAGLLVGAPSLRLKGDYLAIVTLGFGQIISVIFRNIEPLGGALGLNKIPSYTNLFWAFGAAAVTVYVITAMVNSTYGRGFIATHDDEIAAEAMGINTTRCKIVAFVIGAFFAGIAGGLYGHFELSISPRGFDFNKSVEIVVMVIVGGMGNTLGVVLAAILLTLLPEGLRMLSGVSPSLHWIGESRLLLYSLLLIAMMLLRPQGLFNFRKSARTKV
ncbi:MAG TPA: branched-chain amino acid ABC transporter permease [Candidatus Sulfotelmatobacter sp.]|jgi:branched-chain amino acid transport system permease protein|nr:branched-chain amino acid ABC transporter permease [Candidatus Sulfotelmatobacter sp.]